jgi:AraC family transcriptional regulator
MHTGPGGRPPGSPSDASIHEAPPPPAGAAPCLDIGRNFGALTCELRGHDLLVNAADHAPRMIVPRHVHENAYLCVVVTGGFELEARSRVACGPGSVVAYPAGGPHANRFGEARGRCVNLHFGASWLHDAALRGWLADFRHAALGEHAPAVRRLARETAARDGAAALALTAAAVELVAEAMRAPAPSAAPSAIRRVVDLLEADLANAPALAALAREAGLHPSHLARSFRAALGETVGEYVRRRRVEQSLRALALPELSLADVAAAAGFADQAHFGRVFKRHFGTTPGARRREMQGASQRATGVQDRGGERH